MNVKDIQHKLKDMSNPEVAKNARNLFLSNLPDDKQNNDRFMGVTVANIRNIAFNVKDASLTDLRTMLNSEWHEERMLALLIMAKRFGKADIEEQKNIFDLYIKHTHKINCWDLVDISAAPIMGAWLNPRNRSILYQLADSGSVWEKRIAIVSTYYFIKGAHYSETFKLCELLFNEKEQLIHKACGWMLREVGKQDLRELVTFLKRCNGRIPKLILLTATEDLDEQLKNGILAGTN